MQGCSPARSSNSNGFGLNAVDDGEPLQGLRRTVTYHPEHSIEDSLEELRMLIPVHWASARKKDETEGREHM